MSLTQFRTRAQQVTLVLTDCDGVLTDNTVYYSANGEEMKRFSIRDGMGVERLRNAGIQTGIITGENSLSLKSRAAKLKLRYLFQAVNDKRGHLGGISYQTGAEINQMAYIGDDVNDLEIIEAINEGGLTAAPHDAMPQVLQVVHYRCSAAGGQGAFREFAKWLIDGAVLAGCDAVKFQKRTPHKCVPVEQWYLERDTPWGRLTYIEYREKMEFDELGFRQIDRHCRDRGILWFASCWDEESVDFMERFDPPSYKAASACLTDINLLLKMKSTSRPLIVSTGMSTSEEIDISVELAGR